MMANQNTAEATHTGEHAVLKPSGFEIDGTQFEKLDRYLDGVEPEVVSEIAIEVDVLKGWLQARTKEYILQEIVPPFINENDTALVEALSEDMTPVDLEDVKEAVILPELVARQAELLEDSFEIVTKQIPTLAERSRIASENHSNTLERVERVKVEGVFSSYEPTVEDLEKKASRELERKELIDQDLRNKHLIAHKDEGTFLFIDELVKDQSPTGELALITSHAVEAARPYALTEAIDLLEQRSEAVKANPALVDAYQQKIEALKVELSEQEDFSEETMTHHNFVSEVQSGAESRRISAKVFNGLLLSTAALVKRTLHIK